MAATGREKLYVSSDGGPTITAQEVADLGGGGDGDVLAGLPVVPGFITPLANADMFIVFEGGEGLFITNYQISSAMDGIIRAWLEALPGYAEGAVLTVVSNNIEWAAP